MTTYQNIRTAIEAAQLAGLRHIVIEIDEGRVAFTPKVAIKKFETLAPGEGFQIECAWDQQRDAWTWDGSSWTPTGEAGEDAEALEEDEDCPELRTINRADYAACQDRIHAALDLIDDLQQEAYDHGQQELASRLHTAYDDLEKFRIIKRAIRVGDVVESGGEIGIVTSITTSIEMAGVMFAGGERPIRVPFERLTHSERLA